MELISWFKKNTKTSNRSYQQNRQTSAMSRKCTVHVTSVSGPKKSVAVDHKAARASVQRGKPQKPMDGVSLYITSKCCGTHTRSSPHPHPHTRRFVLTNWLKRLMPAHNTFSLLTQMCTLKDREKRTEEKGNASSSPSEKRPCAQNCFSLFYFSNLIQILSCNL